ncbi:unnamed protein product [Musa textilis]
MGFLFSVCRFIITNCLIWLFGFLAMHLFRIRKGSSCQRENLKASSVHDSRRVEPCPEINDSSFEEKESPRLSFKFQYQLSAHHKLLDEVPLPQPVAKENESSVNTAMHNYRFLPEKDFRCFMAEPEAQTCRIQESYVDPAVLSSYDSKSVKAADHDLMHTIDKLDGIRDEKFPYVKLFEQEKHIRRAETNLSGEIGRTDQAKFPLDEFSVFDSDTESLSASDGYSVKELIADLESDGLLSEYEHEVDSRQASIDASRYNVKLSEDFRRLEAAQSRFVHDYDSESAAAIDKFSFVDNQRRCKHISRDENLPENESDSSDPEQKGLDQGEAGSNQVQEFEEPKQPTSDVSRMENIDSGDDELHATERHSSVRKSYDDIRSSNESVTPDSRQENLDEKETGSDADIDSTDSRSSNSSRDLEFTREFNVSRDDFSERSPGTEQEDSQLMAELDELAREEELEGGKKEAKESKKEQQTYLEDSDDDDELESLWEHQDLIEKLKLELKRVRAIGLPTISELSEAPKAVDDLKPWKIDNKFLHEDPMDELQKFYRCYRERVRKLDVLNHQKVHAIGLLQLKDPLQSTGSQKSLLPTITSVLSQSLWTCSRESGISPSDKFIKELQNDLEMVYVGQTCLSWEFLHWQFEKARQISDSDSYRSHQYNQVAGEFQQFQVIMQRFIEDEAFQGPRLPNYVKTRSAFQNFLLVPVIREDSSKEKLEDRRKGNYVITSEILEDIMEESIRLFWEFVKADKDETPGILKGLMGTHVQPHDPSDSKLMADIHSKLQERKLKDILRTGNCLVKKFKKPKEDRSNQDLFFSQVDLKLVARVLRMSRIATDQLVWCHAKLSNISFIEGRVHREPSFLLFPC